VAAAQSSGHELRRTEDSRDEHANTSWKALREKRFDEIDMPDTPLKRSDRRRSGVVAPLLAVVGR
jgi:hypothetical protein